MTDALLAELKAFEDFISGAEPVTVDGKKLWFGETDAMGRNYWWRSKLLHPLADKLRAALAAPVQPLAQEAVAEVISAWGDPEAFGEREVKVLADLSKIRYGTKLYAAPQPAPRAPQGWVAVPVEPTLAMIEAAVETPGFKAIDNVLLLQSLRNGGRPIAEVGNTPQTSPLAQAYRAMLAAAPALPTPLTQPQAKP